MDIVERLRHRALSLRGLGGIGHDDADLDDEAADEIERLREALRFYAKTDYFPTSDGPWGVDSDDFGNVARAALKDGE